jgi:hypothetical protein
VCELCEVRCERPRKRLGGLLGRGISEFTGLAHVGSVGGHVRARVWLVCACELGGRFILVSVWVFQKWGLNDPPIGGRSLLGCAINTFTVSKAGGCVWAL